MLMRPHAVHGEDKEGDHKHEAEYNTYALESDVNDATRDVG